MFSNRFWSYYLNLNWEIGMYNYIQPGIIRYEKGVSIRIRALHLWPWEQNYLHSVSETREWLRNWKPYSHSYVWLLVWAILLYPVEISVKKMLTQTLRLLSDEMQLMYRELLFKCFHTFWCEKSCKVVYHEQILWKEL